MQKTKFKTAKITIIENTQKQKCKNNANNKIKLPKKHQKGENHAISMQF